MLFRGLAIFALLALMPQAPSPSVHQAAGPAGAAAPGTNPPAIDTNCGSGPCDYMPAHITVANPPRSPAPVTWPVRDRIAWAANLVLVVLGYVAMMMALATLRKIERQTKVAEDSAAAATDSARAALLYAEAITRAERPWILISVEPSRTVKNGFLVTAANRGRTPAAIVASIDRTTFARDESALPVPPQYEDGMAGAPFVPIILLPGESTEIKSFSRDDVKGLCASAEKLKQVEDWEEKIYLYGKVTYGDLISPRDNQTHETAWCCWYIHGRQKSGLVMSGPPAYNGHT